MENFESFANRSMNSQFNNFIKETHALTGKEIHEHDAWNTEVNAQSIKHFAYGIADDNPLWLDPSYAAKGPFGKLAAPPTFLTSIKYPVIHGAPVAGNMIHLINEVEMHWFRPILLGDQLYGTTVQHRVSKGFDRSGIPILYVKGRTSYFDQNEKPVAQCNAVCGCIQQQEDPVYFSKRKPHRYSDNEIKSIKKSILKNFRRGNSKLDPSSLKPGTTLPTIVRGPFDINDIVCWNAAVGPRQRSSALGEMDRSNGTGLITNPVTRWAVSRSQSSFDPNVASQRGMNAPFDNGVMRFSWISVLLTDWMGDHCQLKHLRIRMAALVIYGDTCSYSGTIIDSLEARDGTNICIQIKGTNQLDTTVVTGEATILIPSTPKEFPKAFSVKNTTCPDTNKSTVLDLFQKQLETNPEAIAVEDKVRVFNYREFNEATEKVASHLIAAKILPNTPVGVLLPRSANSVVAALAILKAGGIYVPVDPNIPARRKLFILSDAQIEVVLTAREFEEEVLSAGIKLLTIEDITNDCEDKMSKRISTPARAKHLAYAIYTSGSAGTPKGVAVSHYAFHSYLQSLTQTFPPQADEVYLNTAPFSFSASIRQTFLPLLNGIPQYVASESERKDPTVLMQVIETKKITIWDTVPSYWQECIKRWLNLVDRKQTPHIAPSLQKVFLTGEKLDWKSTQQWYDDLEHKAQIYNLYSQTETVGTVAYYPVPRVETDGGTVPIGKALPDVELMLLNEDNDTVAPGETGEVCVISNRLADHYINNPDLTSHHFGSQPSNGRDASRLYHTGDYAIQSGDGVFEFRGRQDRRIKLAGNRVELNEIENLLNSINYVNESAVISDLNESTAKVIAFIVFAQAHFTTDQVRSILEQKLPSSAIPGFLVPLPDIPRNERGKIDYKTLAAYDYRKKAKQSESIPARTNTEKRLIAIWEKLLLVQPIGISDSFFAIGGDSLATINMLTEIEREFTISLTPDAMFNLTTIEKLAKKVDACLRASQSPSIANGFKNNGRAKSSLATQFPNEFKRMIATVAGRKGDRAHPESLIINITPPNENTPLFFCANGLQEVTPLAQGLGTEVPLYFLESGYDVLQRRVLQIKALAEHHVEDILALQPEGPYKLMGYSFGCSTTFEIARILKQRGAEIAFLGMLDARIGPHPIYAYYRKLGHQFYSFTEDWKARKKQSPTETIRFLTRKAKSFFQQQIVDHEEKAFSNDPRYWVPPYEDPIHLFRAREHFIRNIVFPNAGWPKKDFPDLQIIPADGHHLNLVKDQNAEELAKLVRPFLEEK